MHKIVTTCLLSVACVSQSIQAGSLTVRILNDAGQPLPDAVVYLASDQAGTMMPDREFEIEQKEKMFLPFVTILPVGAKAMFPNRDGIGHHVYSFSPAKSFQLPLSEHESTDTIIFDQPGIVTVGCNIHDWMVAYIYIVDTTFYAKSSDTGIAVIEDLPDGEYEIHVTHPGIDSPVPLNRRINTSSDSTQEFILELKPEYFWRPAPQKSEEIY